MKRAWICGGCGISAYGEIKPYDWYIRSDEDGEQIACSRPCIEIIAKKTGKTSVVAPF